jgi:threonine dehydrogenase-like Zn-dependent dehydrogenase
MSQNRSPGAVCHRVIVTRHGGPDVKVVEDDLPKPRAGEVRVKVLAAGVSSYDLMFRRSGSLPGTPRVPFTLGADVVGVVHKLGEGVSALEPGQTVAGATFCLGTRGGYVVTACIIVRSCLKHAAYCHLCRDPFFLPTGRVDGRIPPNSPAHDSWKVSVCLLNEDCRSIRSCSV